MIRRPTRRLKKLQDEFAVAWKILRDADIELFASGLVFSTVLALVPFLSVCLAIFHYFDGFDAVLDVMRNFMLTHVNFVSGHQWMAYVEESISRVHGGALGGFGSVFLIFSTTFLMSDIDRAIQQVWGLRHNRKFLRRLPWYWLFVILGPIALAVFLGVILSANLFDTSSKWLTVMILTLLWGLLCLIYKGVPNTRVKWTHALISSFVTLLLLYASKVTYSFATMHLLSYNKIYGSLAVIPISLLWLFVVWVVILFGAALGVTFHHRNSKLFRS